MTVELASLLVSRPEIRHGRPCIAGTGISVHRVATWDQMGWPPEEMVRRCPHLPLEGVFAALAYYYANKKQVDAEIAEDDAIADAYEEEYRRAGKSVA